MTGLPAICIRPGCGRNFTTNLDGTMTETCYCREAYAASGAEG